MTLACVNADGNSVEVGTVRWGRDLDLAFERSKETGKPIAVLFQEVPGCAGCQMFGKTVLEHELLVEAFEEEFIPVLVFNNREGKDKLLLERFNEPAWNYQVVRFLDAKGNDVIPRKDRVWNLEGIASRMILSLEALNRPIPKYLEVIAEEHNVINHSTVAFSMHCFWTGELELGRIDGVISTEAGWIDGNEVVKIIYNREKISLLELAEKARGGSVIDMIYVDGIKKIKDFTIRSLEGGYRKAKDSDQKKQVED